MNNTAATIIMPLYASESNEIENYFKKSIEGILNQSDKDYQVVIIDDNSPKEIYYLAKKYIDELNDKRFIIIRNKKNRGPGYCRNIGIDYAYRTNSPFILYNDSDDISNPKRVEMVRKKFQNKSVDLVYSTFIPIDENDKEIDYKELCTSLKNILDGHKNAISKKNAFIELATEKNYTNLTSSTAVRTNLAYKYKFPAYRVSEDAYTWFQYFANGGFVYYDETIPTKYRLKGKGSSNSRQKIKDFYKIKVDSDSKGFEKAFKIYKRNNKVLKNEKVKIYHDFYNCLYNVVKEECSEKVKKLLLKKINKFKGYLDINIKDAKQYVVQVIVPQPEGRVGGSDTHVLSLCENIKTYEPVILFTKNTEYLDKIINNEISYIYCGNCKNNIKKLYLLSDLPKKYNIKVIHSHQYNANYLTSAIKFFNEYWRKISCVMTCHGWIENNIKDKYYTFWDFFTYLFSDFLICVSKKDLNRLNKNIFFKNKKKAYIPNGVKINNTRINKNTILKKYNLPNNKKIAAFVGRLAPEKRVDLVLKSAKINCQRDDIIYLICGSGDEENKIKELISSYKLENKVFMLGHISNIQEIYSIIDILVLASDTEGTPRVVLEAMSNEICVVATNVGGLKEIIDNNKNGILVNKGDYKSISEKIDYLLSNDAIRKKYAESGKKKIISEFNINEMSEKIENIYDVLPRVRK